MFEFYICVYAADTSKANVHSCKPKKVTMAWAMSLGMVPKTDVNYTNKLENKWYSWRQTSTILYLLIRKIPAQEHYAVRDYWINSIKIDQMPRRKIYLFLRPSRLIVVDAIFRFWMSAIIKYASQQSLQSQNAADTMPLIQILTLSFNSIPFHLKMYYLLCNLFTTCTTTFASLFSPVWRARFKFLNKHKYLSRPIRLSWFPEA